LKIDRDTFMGWFKLITILLLFSFICWCGVMMYKLDRDLHNCPHNIYEENRIIWDNSTWLGKYLHLKFICYESTPIIFNLSNIINTTGDIYNG
jgi:hypothetical protein